MTRQPVDSRAIESPRRCSRGVKKESNSMTQRILDCNQIPTAQTYDVAHLRTAESIEQLFAYVDAGHPLAYVSGMPVRLLRRLRAEKFCFDSYSRAFGEWVAEGLHVDNLLHCIKLAPLAYSNGRPLYVGNFIEVLHDEHENGEFEWVKGSAMVKHHAMFNDPVKAVFWRFAQPQEAA